MKLVDVLRMVRIGDTIVVSKVGVYGSHILPIEVVTHGQRGEVPSDYYDYEVVQIYVDNDDDGASILHINIEEV